MQPKRFMAGSVPRSIRQSRLTHLPTSSVIGSHYQRGGDGSNLVFDVVMLPEQEFQRIKTSVGLRQVLGPAFKADATFQPGYSVVDIKQVVVPADVPDQMAYAKSYFLKEFGLQEWAGANSTAEQQPQKQNPKEGFAKAAKDTVIDVDFTVIKE